MITAALYGVLGGLVGILVFLAAPVVADPLGDKWRYIIGRTYFTMSMKAYQRVIATISPHNDLEIRASSWDHDDQAETIETGDQTEKRTDPKGISARCKNVPFQLTFTDSAFILHPLDAHVGNALDRIRTEGRRWMEFVVPDSDGEEQIVRAHSAHANIPSSDSFHALDMQRARIALNESHEAGDMYKTRRDVEKSQSGYDQRDILQMGVILLACFGGALSAWVIYSNTGSTESAVRLPVTIFGWWL